MSNSDDSDYKVEDYVIPDSVRNTYRNEDTISDNERGAEESENDSEISQHGEEEIKTPQCKFNGGNDSEQEVDPETPRPNSRFILYVTNLSGETTKTMLEDFFGDAGDIKAIRQVIEFSKISDLLLSCFQNSKSSAGLLCLCGDEGL